jgi:hypothetical protein
MVGDGTSEVSEAPGAAAAGFFDPSLHFQIDYDPHHENVISLDEYLH